MAAEQRFPDVAHFRAQGEERHWAPMVHVFLIFCIAPYPRVNPPLLPCR